VHVKGQRSPLVGQFSNDKIAGDFAEVADVEVGSRGVLWGADLTVEEVARHAGTIAYELLCRVSQRVPRQIL
jgi:alanine racemase